MNQEKKIAVYPGSFDPVTLGHMDIIKRSAVLFDTVIVAVLSNSAKTALFSSSDRVNMIQELVRDYPNVIVESFEGLLVDYARFKNARIIIRGLRAVSDFEYELQIAQTNRVENPQLDTLFLTTSLNYSYISSTIVREFASYGGDISPFVPEEIIPLIEAKYQH